MAFRLHLSSKYEELLAAEESASDPHEMFKILGMRRATRDFIKILPEFPRGTND